jgi:alcohol dehydrogenase class IV
MGENLKGVSLLEGSLRAVSAIRNFLRRIDMPHRLADLGIDRGKIREMSEMAIINRSTQINARAITLEEMIDLYEKAS